MRALWRKLRAWRAGRKARYSERWHETKPYDSKADQYLPPAPPESFPPAGGGPF